MPYHANFYGEFTLDKPLTVAHHAYLTKFSSSRRMRRSTVANTMPCPERDAAGLVGPEFYLGTGTGGQNRDSSIIDYNSPPPEQPGLWCGWRPNESGTAIGLPDDTSEESEKWIQYVIATFLVPWGYVLNGAVQWEGEEHGDVGEIVVANNVVTIRRGRIVYDTEPELSRADENEIVLWVVSDGARFNSWWVDEKLARQRAHELRNEDERAEMYRTWICTPLRHAANDDIASVEQLLLKLGAWLHERKA